MTEVSASARRLSVPPVISAILFGGALGAVLVLFSGGNPLAAYWSLLEGALAPRNWPNTLNWAVPLVGMTLVAAIPLRGGMINLGGDGQMVVGGLVAALLPLYLPQVLPLPGPVIATIAILLAMLAGGLYAALSAVGQVRFGVPMLISSLLLSYPAIGIASYLVGFHFRDPSSGLSETRMIPADVRLMVLSGPLTISLVLMMVVALVVVLSDRQTVAGYELRMRGMNPRFAGYGGVALGRQMIRVMLASGAIAGLVGAVIVLGSLGRFTDGALITPGYTWSGLMAALLARGEPIAAVVAGLFFAGLQTGGFAMQRDTDVPRVLTMVLQAIIILFLAVRHGVGRRS